ncbi:FAD/NAD(P)-binding domain-containing protein [Cadophora sp. DSE1049]|nr:FAD/NAD(P)-binding domain-containing protein [Cadophora sp. DSE1049]
MVGGWGGPAGFAAALQLCPQNKFICAVYELRSCPSTLGGALGVPCNGSRLLVRLGVYESLLTRGAVTMHSKQGATFGSVDIAKRRYLMEQLLDEVEKEVGICVQLGKKVASISQDEFSVQVTFVDGTKDTGDILLGCDGIHLDVQTMYIDPFTQPEYSGLASIFSVLTHPRLTNTTPIQDLNATLTADGLFAVIPSDSAANEVCWFFTEETKLVHGALQEFGGEWGSFLKKLFIDSDSGRVLLLGDAAPAMQPYAGQGAAMALEDVFLLSRLFQSLPISGAQKSIRQSYKRFEELRRPRVKMFHKAAANSGELRKRMPSWNLALFEKIGMYGLWVFNMLRLDRMGMSGSQGTLVYDIESVPLWHQS